MFAKYLNTSIKYLLQHCSRKIAEFLKSTEKNYESRKMIFVPQKSVITILIILYFVTRPTVLVSSDNRKRHFGFVDSAHFEHLAFLVNLSESHSHSKAEELRSVWCTYNR